MLMAHTLSDGENETPYNYTKIYLFNLFVWNRLTVNNYEKRCIWRQPS